MTKIIKSTLLAVVLLTIGIFAGVYGKGVVAKFVSAETKAESAKGKTVAAVVDGYNIYKEDIISIINKMSNGQQVDMKKAYPVFLSQLVTDRLVEAEVAKSGIKKSDLFKAKLEEAEKNIVKGMYFEKALAGKISEDDVKKEYEAIKAKNNGVKEARARHILVKTEEEAKQVIKDLAKGKKFEDLAAERSTDATAKKGGDLGYFAKEGELVPEFANAAFALKKGEYTKEPVKTQLGFHVIKLEDMRDRKVPSYDELKATINNNIVQNLVMENVKELRAKAKVEMFDFDGNKIPEVANAPAPMGAN